MAQSVKGRHHKAWEPEFRSASTQIKRIPIISALGKQTDTPGPVRQPVYPQQQVPDSVGYLVSKNKGRIINEANSHWPLTSANTCACMCVCALCTYKYTKRSPHLSVILRWDHHGSLPEVRNLWSWDITRRWSILDQTDKDKVRPEKHLPTMCWRYDTTYLHWSYLVADLEFGLEVNNTVAAGNYLKENTGNWGSSYNHGCWKKSVSGEFLFGKANTSEGEAEVVANDQILPRPPSCTGRILDRYMSLFFLNSVTHWSCVWTQTLTWKHSPAWDLVETNNSCFYFKNDNKLLKQVFTIICFRLLNLPLQHKQKHTFTY